MPTRNYEFVLPSSIVEHQLFPDPGKRPADYYKSKGISTSQKNKNRPGFHRHQTMFQEKEEGQPKRWGSLIATIIIVFSLSLLLVIVLRILLDSEDEINMPLIQGKLREDMTYFLGIFTMTFFFGCWCCFCCACACCKWCVYQFPQKLANLWKAIPHLFVDNLDHLPIHRYRETDESNPHEAIVIEPHHIDRPSQLPKQADMRAYENAGFHDALELHSIQSPRLILPPAPNGRFRSQSVDISAIV